MQKLILFTLLVLSAASSAATDPFNAYIWNHANHNAANGEVDTGDWFEWWYFKVVDPQTQDGYFFTYGVINPWDSNTVLAGTRAVISAGDFKNHLQATEKFTVDQFTSAYNKTAVSVGTNTATDKH